MPRVASVSGSSTLWPIRRRPMPSTTFAWFLLKPIVLFTSVTLTRFPSACFCAFFAIACLSSGTLDRCRLGRRFLFLAAQTTDEGRVLELAERLEGRPHDV